MHNFLKIIIDSYIGYWNYLLSEISKFHPTNYFYWVLFFSVFTWFLEVVFPWRKEQAIFRKDFWLDGFYIFFNYFIFSLIAYNAISNLGVELFEQFLSTLGFKNIVAIEISSWPKWAQMCLLFIVSDFIQWNIHQLMHKNAVLWNFHKVHHSVKEMGFAAHLRFHWVETIIYKTAQYIPLAMIGYSIKDFFIVHMFSLAIGHLNHANLNFSYGWFGYIFNNPKMHIWHHAKTLPNGRDGVNFGLTLSIWDYIFKTHYVPKNGRDIELGFKNDEKFPNKFLDQMVWPFKKTS